MADTLSALTELRSCLDAQRVTRVLLLTGPGRRFVDRVTQLLQGLELSVFDGAEVHVPEAVVARAQAEYSRFRPQAVVTLGGGSATGLGKALRLGHEFLFVAIPTTYAGSEMTSIYGITSGKDKKTGRDDRVRPDIVIHDPDLTRSMPRRLTVTSLMNALAHPLSALGTANLDDEHRALALGAVAEIVKALEILVADPVNEDARRLAVRGAAAAGSVLDAGVLGDHHRVAHHLGGRLGADHGTLHACLLPHSTAALLDHDPALAREIGKTIGFEDLPRRLFDMLRRVGAPTALPDVADPDVVASAVDELADMDLSPEVLEWCRAAVLGREPLPR